MRKAVHVAFGETAPGEENRAKMRDETLKVMNDINPEKVINLEEWRVSYIAHVKMAGNETEDKGMSSPGISLSPDSARKRRIAQDVKIQTMNQTLLDVLEDINNGDMPFVSSPLRDKSTIDCCVKAGDLIRFLQTYPLPGPKLQKQRPEEPDFFEPDWAQGINIVRDALLAMERVADRKGAHPGSPANQRQNKGAVSRGRSRIPVIKPENP